MIDEINVLYYYWQPGYKTLQEIREEEEAKKAIQENKETKEER